MNVSHILRLVLATIIVALTPSIAGCESDVDVTVESTPFPDGSTAIPFPFDGVEASYVGVSGNYPYVLLYEDGFSCEELSDPQSMPGQRFTNILILVGGWEEGEYPIIDILSAGGNYSLEGNAIAYMAERRFPTLEEQEEGYSSPILESVEYASAGTLLVDQINQVTTTAKGSFELNFDAGDLLGDYTIREYCDLY